MTLNPDDSESDGRTRSRPEAEFGDETAAVSISEEAGDDDHSTRLNATVASSDRARVKDAPKIEPEDRPPSESATLAGGADPANQTSSSPPVTEKTRSVSDRRLENGYVLHHRYRVVKRLGKGGFGAVYLAQDLKLERLCVIKQMLAKYWSPKMLETLRANFEREAKLLVQLNHPGHPNIPEIYDHFFDAASNYLVMKYIEGRDLKLVLEQNGRPLPVEETIPYAVDLCSALHYMHTYGQEPVIHRDIKPGNILLGDDGRIWLVDFGLAKAQPVEDAHETAMTRAYGSLGYSPLEQWFGEPTPASDIYALGATLHHLLSGLNPADVFGDNRFNIVEVQQRHGQFVPLRQVNRHIPKTVEAIISSAVGADPNQRPTALQLQQQLKMFISGAKDAPLFTFKNGEAAAAKGQLVDLCDQYRAEAQGYLYRGDFERWFRLLNRNDLAEAAAQAVNRGKNQADGLEKFLKLIFPNLVLRRLGRTARRAAALALQFGVILIAVGFLLALGGSWLAGAFLQRAIGDYDVWRDSVPWQDSYTEAELNHIAQTSAGALFDDIFVDIRPPARLGLNLNWNGLVVALLLEQARQGQPYHFQLIEINGLPLTFVPLIPDNISQGLNAGLDTALCQANLKINTLDLKTKPINETFVIDTLYLDRTPTVCSEGAPLPPIAQPAPSPDREVKAGLGLFNQSSHKVVVKLKGPVFTQTTVMAKEKRIIDAPPGNYEYEIGRLIDEPEAIIQGRLTLTTYYRLEIVE